MTTYTDRDRNPLWVLVGAQGCRSYHLTSDTRAAQFEYDTTDSRPEIEFAALCNKTISHTIVQPYTITPTKICKNCTKRATAKENQQ